MAQQNNTTQQALESSVMPVHKNRHGRVTTMPSAEEAKPTVIRRYRCQEYRVSSSPDDIYDTTVQPHCCEHLLRTAKLGARILSSPAEDVVAEADGRPL